ncbi:MAG: hypothetical protein TREMPRED_003617, partial [Tremellales sp. Tagirdzhanova-0007]
QIMGVMHQPDEDDNDADDFDILGPPTLPPPTYSEMATAVSLLQRCLDTMSDETFARSLPINLARLLVRFRRHEEDARLNQADIRDFFTTSKADGQADVGLNDAV